jgi:chromate reductase
MSERAVKILGIPGSLRAGSFNRALIQTAIELAPPEVDLELYLLGDIPLYNADVEAEGDPEPVRRFKRAIADADGLLISTPQYNRSVSGVLKNAIDWASRPPADCVLAGKPAAIMGASIGQSATAVAQEDLRKILEACRCRVLDGPRLGVGVANEHIDEVRGVHNAETRAAVKAIVAELAAFIRAPMLAEAD